MTNMGVACPWAWYSSNAPYTLWKKKQKIETKYENESENMFLNS